MKYLMFLLILFLLVPLNIEAQQLDLTTSISGPFVNGVAQTDIPVYNTNVGLSLSTKKYNSYFASWGDSELFHHYYTVGAYNNKLRLSVTATNYYYNPRLALPDQSWGWWFGVSKKWCIAGCKKKKK